MINNKILKALVLSKMFAIIIFLCHVICDGIRGWISHSVIGLSSMVIPFFGEIFLTYVYFFMEEA